MGKGCPGPAIYAVSQLYRNQQRAMFGPQQVYGLGPSQQQLAIFQPEVIDAEIVEEPVYGESAKWGEQWLAEAKIKKAPSSSCPNCGAVQKEMKNSRLVCAYCGG